MAESKKKEKMFVIGACVVGLLGLQGCSNDKKEPVVKGCNDMDWDKKTETWVCDDSSSSHYGHYYYGNSFYSSQNKLKSNSGYKSYLSKGGSSSGFGKKSGFFGG